jgi:hypothetical protein
MSAGSRQFPLFCLSYLCFWYLFLISPTIPSTIGAMVVLIDFDIRSIGASVPSMSISMKSHMNELHCHPSPEFWEEFSAFHMFNSSVCYSYVTLGGKFTLGELCCLFTFCHLRRTLRRSHTRYILSRLGDFVEED